MHLPSSCICHHPAFVILHLPWHAAASSSIPTRGEKQRLLLLTCRRCCMRCVTRTGSCPRGRLWRRPMASICPQSWSPSCSNAGIRCAAKKKTSARFSQPTRLIACCHTAAVTVCASSSSTPTCCIKPCDARQGSNAEKSQVYSPLASNIRSTGSVQSANKFATASLCCH